MTLKQTYETRNLRGYEVAEAIVNNFLVIEFNSRPRLQP